MEQKTKYNAKKTVIDEIKFDSKKEAKRYEFLRDLQKEGVIADLKVQPKYLLIKTRKYLGDTIRSVSYIADFSYTYQEKTHVEDVKSKHTAKIPKYVIKKKLFIQKYGEELIFREVFKHDTPPFRVPDTE